MVADQAREGRQDFNFTFYCHNRADYKGSALNSRHIRQDNRAYTLNNEGVTQKSRGKKQNNMGETLSLGHIT